MKIIVDSVRGKIFDCPKDLSKNLYTLCSYRHPQYQFSNAYLNGVWDGYIRKYTTNNSFPSGLLFRITQFLNKKNIKYELLDTRKKFKIDEKVVLENIEKFGLILRPYQIDGLIMGINNPYMIFWFATASGKTVVFSSLITAFKAKNKFRKTLILVALTDLAFQHREEVGKLLGTKMGLIEEGRFEPEDITVSVINTLWNRAIKKKDNRVLKYLENVEYLIVDECFDGKQVVLMPDGSQKIIKRIIEDKDEYVMSLSSNGILEKKRVLRWISRPYFGKMLRIKFRNLRGKYSSIVCTPSHKFFLEDESLVRADKLKKFDWVKFVVRRDKGCLVNLKSQNGRHLSGGRRIFCITLSKLNEHISHLSTLSGLSKKIVKEKIDRILKIIDLKKGRIAEHLLVYALVHDIHLLEKKLGHDINIHHVNNNHYDNKIENLELHSHGDHSRISGNQYSSSPKDLEISEAFVLSVEEVKNVQTFTKCVYNLEIEETNRYFVNCVLVSNCHHVVESKMMKQVINKCKNTIARHGFSGSPYSLTIDDIELECYTGPPLSKVTLSDLIREGWISRPHVYILKYEFPFMKGVYYQTAYKKGIVKNEIRNRMIVDICKNKYLNSDKTILILIRMIQHGKILKDMLLDSGIENSDLEYVHGSTPKFVRSGVKEKFRNKEIRIVIASQIWNEGVNIPSVDVLIKADGGGGHEIKGDKGVRSVVQQIGRVLRKPLNGIDVDTSIENIVEIYDFNDNIHKDLARHSKNRIDTYKMEKEFVIHEEKGYKKCL